MVGYLSAQYGIWEMSRSPTVVYLTVANLTTGGTYLDISTSFYLGAQLL